MSYKIIAAAFYAESERFVFREEYLVFFLSFIIATRPWQADLKHYLNILKKRPLKDHSCES
jgi:hypothetical protein